MSSNFQREKPLHPGFLTHKRAQTTPSFNNYWLRNPALPSRWRRGSCGNNEVTYNSPYYAIKSKGSWRTCSTSPDLRTSESCIEHPY